jgi:hypothetical protein
MTLDAHSRPDHLRPRASAKPARAVVVLGLLGTFVAVAWVAWNAVQQGRLDGRGGLSPFLKVSRDVPAGGRYPGDPYIGSKACAACHPGEYALFTGSGHALTFRRATEHAVTDRLVGAAVADPESPGVLWRYSKKDNQFLIDRDQAGKIEQFVADYALGSGHHATTYVTALDLEVPKILEHRLTFFTKEAELKITPGQAANEQNPGTTPHGRELAGRDARKCLRCHATQLSARDDSVLEPGSMIPAVTCERCHGPGRAHVEAAVQGDESNELSMPMGLGGWTAESLLEFCGKCHRHPSRVPPSQLNPDDPILARFQPIGLTQSRCYKGSGGHFNCISCHDAHARSTSDPAFYERVCLNCHNSDRSHQAGAAEYQAESPVLGPACPVSPSGKCISCHMPKVDSGQHVLFTDHWIRVRSAVPKH